MGWLFGYNTRKELIDHLTTGNGVHTVKHCCVGNTMWAVQEGTHNQTGETVRFIACYLLAKERGAHGWWGYKDMDESAHPYYYTCPLSYLAITPEACPEWRARVRARAATRGLKLVPGDSIEYGGIEYLVLRKVSAGKYHVQAGTGPTYTVTSKHLAHSRLVPRTVVEYARHR